MVQYKPVKALATLLLLPIAAVAARVEFAQQGMPEFADTEVSTNVAIVADSDRMCEIAVRFAVGSASNCLQVAFGRDADGDGILGIVDVVQTLANRGVRVIIAGLDTDFLGKPFGPMPALMAIAEDVQKVHAICVRCGNLANHSHRLSASTKLVELGEKDVYEPLCRQCYNAARAEQKQ